MWETIAHFHHFSMFNQNQSVSNLVMFEQCIKAIALVFGKQSLIFITFQCSITVSQFQIWSFLSKCQGYSLTFWPKIAHFYHLSMFNQNQSISNVVSFEQNTKAIALLCGQKSLIFITSQCSITINQYQIWSFLSKIPRL